MKVFEQKGVITEINVETSDYHIPSANIIVATETGTIKVPISRETAWALEDMPRERYGKVAITIEVGGQGR